MQGGSGVNMKEHVRDTMGVRRSEGEVKELSTEEGTERYYEEIIDFFFERNR